MPNTFRLCRGAALCDYDVSGQQVRLTISGPITPSVLDALGPDLNRIGTRLLAKSIVVDLRPAVLAVSYELLVRTPYDLELPLRTLPVGIIPSAASAEVLREYAWTQAKLGLLRGVFRAPEPAAGWAAQKAARRYSRIPEFAR